MNVSVTRSPLLVLSRTPYPAGLLRPQGPRSTRRIHLRTTTSTAPHKYKTIDELPGPTAADTAYLLFVKGYADKSHAMQVPSAYPSATVLPISACLPTTA